MISYEDVYRLTSMVPKGKVTTYGAIARALGVSPRFVAAALKANPRPVAVPCHRVIMSNRTLGGYSYGGAEVKRRLLEAEGVRFDEDGKVRREYIIWDLRELMSIDKNL